MYSDSYWARYKMISLGPTRSMEKISQKKRDFFPIKNNFGQFFLVLPNMADLRQHVVRLHKVLWLSLSKLHDHFCIT